jgi:hypothetical protein
MGLYPKKLVEYLTLTGIPRGPYSRVFIVDPQTNHGDDDNNGLTWEKPLATLAAAEDLCVANHNDVVALVGGPTGNALAASLAWDKAYTHLVGLSAPLAMGQRCRITGSAAVDATELLAISGRGCHFRNLQLFNGADADAEAAAAVVSGSNNFFEHVFFAGMGHATSAAHIGGCSLQVTGAENTFDDCVIGLDTIIRAAVNYQLKISGQRNTFRKCQVNSWCETATAFMVQIDNSGGDLRWNKFIDTLFYNYRENWGTMITDVFDMPAGGATHDVILQGACMQYGCTGWADTVAHLIHELAAPATGGGIGIAVNA